MFSGLSVLDGSWGGEGLQLYQADCVPPPLLSLGRILVGNPLRCVCGLLWLQSWQQKRQLDWAGNQSFQCLQEDRTLVPVFNLTLSGCGKAEPPPSVGDPQPKFSGPELLPAWMQFQPFQNFPGFFYCCKRVPPQLGGVVFGSYLKPPLSPSIPVQISPRSG